MPALLTPDTRNVLGPDAEKCENRSWWLSRLAGEELAEPGQRLLRLPPLPHLLKSWRDFLMHQSGATVGELIFAKLQARLVVHTGLSSLGGLALDRLTGVPFIPGSACKGCARRLALAQLRETEELSAKITLLRDIALIFGWQARDWLVPKPGGKPGSDFAWACGSHWPEASVEMEREFSGTAAAGLASFLPAYPGPPDIFPYPGVDLDLDISACHHSAYYRGPGISKDGKAAQFWRETYQQAPDIEEPVTTLFPAVASGMLFIFVVLGARHCPESLRERARQWLSQGLREFGLGARQTAGYGWFDTSEALQAVCREKWQTTCDVEQKRRALEQEERQRRLREEAEQHLAEQREQAMKEMTDEEQADFQLTLLSEDQFRSKVQNFNKNLSKAEKLSVIRVLRGARVAFWEELKGRAAKGGMWAQVEQSVRLFAKKMNLGKMP